MGPSCYNRSVSGSANQEAFSREEVLRVLAISERQLRSWEKQELVPHAEHFGFKDLLALRTLVKLRKDKIPATQIKKALTALRQKIRGVHNPLTELRIYSVGKRVRVEADGNHMEPVSGQLLLDFDRTELKKLLEFPTRPASSSRSSKQEADRWFERGLELEQTGAPMEEIVEAYENAVRLDPTSAGALVNLGTLYFNARVWADAEKHYRAAVEADPNYPLAHFNLGNLYDERGDRPRAMLHYLAALKLHPNYADAHYNIALLFQATGELMKAMRHWKSYLRLDPASSWAAIARRELEKLRQVTLVPGKL